MPSRPRHRHVDRDRPCHRHFVALPLFLAVLGLSAVPALRSSTLTASALEQAGVMALDDGTQVLLSEGGRMDVSGPVPFLQEGSAVVRTEGITQLRTPSCDILAMAGAFHAVSAGASVTVSAITAPVLVSVNGQKAIVPTGMQFSVAQPLADIHTGFAAWAAARTPAPLPQHFFREQLRALRAFPSAPDILPVAQSFMPTDVPVVPTVQLPAAQERARETWRLTVLGALRWHVEHQNDADARAMLDRPAFRTAFADARSLSPLVILAGRSTDGAAGLRPLLFRFLADRHDLWLLAALHPTFHTGAWASGIPSLRTEEQALLAFALPQADRAAQGFSPVVVHWWEQEVTALIAAQRDPFVLTESLLAVLLPVAEQHIADGYPERARTLTQALTTFAEPVAVSLSAEQRAALRDLRHRTEQQIDFLSSSVLPFPETEAESSSSVPLSVASASSVAPLDAQERVRNIESVLERAGALFSLQTKLEPADDGQSVAVRDILFPSSRGDLAYAFTVNVRTSEVSSIVRDGKVMPYPMSLDAFLAWVRQ